MVVGITGGTAAGKTAVAQIMGSLGATVVDADQIGRAVVERRPEVLQQLVDAFGRGILTPEGTLDRRGLGRMAFSSPSKRNKLNAIVHPHLLAALKAQVERALCVNPRCWVVVDAALLPEWMSDPSSAQLLPSIDATVVVIASEATQTARLVAKGLSRQEALQRIRTQMPLDQVQARTQYALHNEGSLRDLEARVQALWQQLQRDREGLSSS